MGVLPHAQNSRDVPFIQQQFLLCAIFIFYSFTFSVTIINMLGYAVFGNLETHLMNVLLNTFSTAAAPEMNLSKVVGRVLDTTDETDGIVSEIPKATINSLVFCPFIGSLLIKKRLMIC